MKLEGIRFTLEEFSDTFELLPIIEQMSEDDIYEAWSFFGCYDALVQEMESHNFQEKRRK